MWFHVPADGDRAHSAPIPKGDEMTNALVPELGVSDLAVSLRFYQALGFEMLYGRQDEGFAYLRLGEAELMLDQNGIGRSFDPGTGPLHRPFGRGMNLQIRVPDIAPLLQVLNGQQLYLPPEDRWYRRDDEEVGNRQFVVADPDGYLLRFFQDLGRRRA
jgi:catechol 2,3-dioxygenase-like lactoylglutathione lyase family enzyme